MSEKRNRYKACFVPGCENTTTTAPEKEYICVPRNENKRKLWCEAVGLCTKKKLALSIYCCEDHFDIKEDLQNYMEYKIMGCRKIMKNNVLPRFFPNRFTNPLTDPLAIDEDEQLNQRFTVQDEERKFSEVIIFHSNEILDNIHYSFLFQDDKFIKIEMKEEPQNI